MNNGLFIRKKSGKYPIPKKSKNTIKLKIHFLRVLFVIQKHITIEKNLPKKLFDLSKILHFTIEGLTFISKTSNYSIFRFSFF